MTICSLIGIIVFGLSAVLGIFFLADMHDDNLIDAITEKRKYAVAAAGAYLFLTSVSVKWLFRQVWLCILWVSVCQTTMAEKNEESFLSLKYKNKTTIMGLFQEQYSTLFIWLGFMLLGLAEFTPGALRFNFLHSDEYCDVPNQTGYCDYEYMISLGFCISGIIKIMAFLPKCN